MIQDEAIATRDGGKLTRQRVPMPEVHPASRTSSDHILQLSECAQSREKLAVVLSVGQIQRLRSCFGLSR